MFDTLIRGGAVVDGTGRPAFAADVAVSGGRIAAIGDLSAASAAHVIDAAGRTVTPGFIDTCQLSTHITHHCLNNFILFFKRCDCFTD